MTAVRDIMTPNPTSISDGVLASEAAQVMLEANVGFLPVMREGRLVGVVTDRDIATRAMPQAGDVAVGEIMSRNTVTITGEAAVEEAERMMSERGVRRLMVCDGDEIVGVVSVGDLAVRVSDSLAGEVMNETGPRDREKARATLNDSFGAAESPVDVGGEIADEPRLAGRPAGIDYGETVDDLLEEGRPEDTEDDRLLEHDSLGSINSRGEHVPGGSDALDSDFVIAGDDPLEGDAELASARILARRDGIARDDEQNGEFGQG